MNNNEVITTVENTVGYTFHDKNLLLEALTHSSFSNEMKINKRNNYERLEFLGDAVLELLSSEYLFQAFPNESEGNLTKKRASMVCEQSLAICARRMRLGEMMFFGKGEELAGGRERDSILCDVVEAVLGAIYLDGGNEAARAYVNNHIITDLSAGELFVDHKTSLQELIQHLDTDSKLSYEVVSEAGPEHDKTFEVEVRLDDRTISRGTGKTKKSAQQDAAYKAIEVLNASNKTDKGLF